MIRRLIQKGSRGNPESGSAFDLNVLKTKIINWLSCYLSKETTAGNQSELWLGPLLISAVVFAGNQLMQSLLLDSFTTDDRQMCKLDCGWYQEIAEYGYTASSSAEISYEKMQNWAFFPLFPIAVSLILKSTHIRSDTATVLASKIFFLLAIYFFIRLAQLHLGKRGNWIYGFVAAFNPYSIYGNSGYSEPLFLTITCLFFIGLHRRIFWVSALWGFLMPLTRLVGIAALGSQGLQLFLTRRVSPKTSTLTALLTMASVPCGLLLFMLYLQQRTGDPLAFIHIQTAWRGSDHTLSAFSWVFALLRGLATKGFWLYPYWALTGIIVISCCGYLLFRGNEKIKPLALFSLICTLIPVSSDTWGLARYIWWQAPVLLFVCGVIISRCHSKAWFLGWATISLFMNAYCYRQWFTPLKWYIS